MRPDNTAPLIAAARRRHELTRSKAIKALRDLDRAGTPITQETIARTAGISRSWLYTQPDLRTQIDLLREATRPALTPPIPARQRTTDESLRARLDTALQRNRTLTEENRRLRRQLAEALGDLRASPPTRTRH